MKLGGSSVKLEVKYITPLNQQLPFFMEPPSMNLVRSFSEDVPETQAALTAAFFIFSRWVVNHRRRLIAPPGAAKNC